MFDSEALRDELKSLKVDLSRVLNVNGEEMLNQSKARAEALADQIKTARNELGEALGQEESHVEKMVAERPIASLASAFALGVVVGSWQAGISVSAENLVKHLRALAYRPNHRRYQTAGIFGWASACGHSRR